MQKYIVVGAGILGASAAYHLAKAGEDVTIIDRFDQGQATDAGAGIVCPWLSQRRNKAWYQLVKGGARYYPELVEQLEADGETETGYKKVGAMSLNTDQEKLKKMAERARKKREDAPEIGEIKILSAEETKKLFPLLSDEYGSVFVSGGARVNGREMRNALIRGAEKHGAKFVKGNAELVVEDNTVVSGVKVDSDVISGDQVLATGGAWADELLKPLGITYHVTFQKGQIVHLEVSDHTTSDWPVVMPPNDQYILSFDHGRVVAGGTHENDVGFDHRVTAGGVHEVLDKAIQVAPGLQDSQLLETRVGFRPFTPGFLPIIGKVPNMEGVLLANGLGSSGLTSGPYLGAELAKLARGVEMEIDVRLYDVAGALEQ
ncbi:NAD(P)/FAD-dependent oxidoreductase [Salinibacillus xinjiangensis]|uniref:FAD-dependent oxidoreductase n=1 Tax=Salinibacillus xinjiangensis TaxID=1229268 RepID=A0A6G1X9B9_9BACI|nr:FAD-dependent oxidoreductase [Salinibacillus xinjiangensis]MRG87470.1 FAD-dependent oxidoreductase [Salinibacillus xinjiangensis]